MVKEYISKPINAKAVQWNGDNYEEIVEFMNGNCNTYNGVLFVHLDLAGSKSRMVNRGEYIVNRDDGIGWDVMESHYFLSKFEEI